jgi:gluconokinase
VIYCYGYITNLVIANTALERNYFANFLLSWQQRGVFGVLCCSALKKKYRDVLLNGATSTSCHFALKSPAPESESETKCTIKDALFVYLRGDGELIERRLRGRANHYMPASLLQSQLQTLEEPDADEPCIVVDISKDGHEIVSDILTHIRHLY